MTIKTKYLITIIFILGASNIWCESTDIISSKHKSNWENVANVSRSKELEKNSVLLTQELQDLIKHLKKSKTEYLINVDILISKYEKSLEELQKSYYKKKYELEKAHFEELKKIVRCIEKSLNPEEKPVGAQKIEQVKD